MVESRHFSIVIADIEGSSGLSVPEKVEAREHLYRILENALRQSGIADEAAITEDRGDAVYLLVEGGIPVRRLIEPFLPAVDAALADRRIGDVKLRLRLVVHQGGAVRDPRGSSGPAVDRAFAMVDAPQLKDLLKRAEGGRLAVVVGDDVYREAVRGYDRPDPYAFRKRVLTVKGGGDVPVWVTVTGVAEQPSHGRPSRVPASPDGGAPAGAGSMRIGDSYRVTGSTIGVVGPVGGDANTHIHGEPGDR